MINLPEEEPENFEIFAAFAYTGCIFSQKEGDLYTDDDGDECDSENDRLAHLWATGEKLQASAFKDAVVDVFIERIRASGSVPLHTFEAIYSASSGASPMRKLHVDIALFAWDTHHIANASRDEQWNDFFADLAVQQHQYVGYERPENAPYEQGPTCIYHEHGNSAACYKTMFK